MKPRLLRENLRNTDPRHRAMFKKYGKRIKRLAQDLFAEGYDYFDTQEWAASELRLSLAFVRLYSLAKRHEEKNDAS